MAEHGTDLGLDGLVGVLRLHVGAVLCNQLVDPVGMDGQRVARLAAGVRALPGQNFRDLRALILQAGWQDSQTHDLDQADVFLFNVVVFPVRVEDAVGVLLARAVVAQGQVKDVALGLVVVQDRRHGVVGRAVGLGQDADALVGVAAPGGQDVVGNILHLLAAAAHQTHGGDRPVQDARLDAGVADVGHRHGDVSLLHRENIPPALEVAVAQDAAADDGQVGVGAAGVVGKLPDEVENFRQRLLVHLHRLVLLVQHDAVLMEVGVGAVLQIELLTRQRDGHNAVGLARREVDAARVADVLLAEHAGGVAGFGLQALEGNRLGVLLGLRQVDGDLQLAVGGGGVPLDVLGDLRGADVVRVDAELIEPVGSGLGALLDVELAELLADLALAGHQGAHQAGLKVDAVLVDRAVEQLLLRGQLDHLVQQGSGGLWVLLRGLGLAGDGQDQQIQQGVARHQNVQIFDELVLAAKAQQTLHVQRQACVALLRGQGCDVKFILCHDCPPVTVYAV